VKDLAPFSGFGGKKKDSLRLRSSWGNSPMKKPCSAGDWEDYLMILRVVLNKQKSLVTPSSFLRSFCFHPSLRRAWIGLKTKIPHCCRSKGFFLVAEAGLFHDPFLGCLTKKKPCPAKRGTTVFFIFIPPLSKLASA